MRFEPELGGYLITYRHRIHQVSFLVFKMMVNVFYSGVGMQVPAHIGG